MTIAATLNGKQQRSLIVLLLGVSRRRWLGWNFGSFHFMKWDQATPGWGRY
jgi:hypothetical protein